MESQQSPSSAAFVCPICQKAFSIRDDGGPAPSRRRKPTEPICVVLCLLKFVSSFGRLFADVIRGLVRLLVCETLKALSRKANNSSTTEGMRALRQKKAPCQYATYQDSSREPALPLLPVEITPPSSEFASDVSPPATVDLGDHTGQCSSTLQNEGSAQGPHSPGQQAPKPHPNSCLFHLCRIYRTYPRMLSTCDKLPPFIHKSQVLAKKPPMPLANCLALCKMWANSSSSVAAGSDFAKTLIKTELTRLLEEYRTYDEATVVAAFQAAVLYAIVLLFPNTQKLPVKMFDLSTLAALKEFGQYIRNGTVMMAEEVSHTRPSWQQWLQVSCKRRSLISFYCFEWMNAMLNNFAHFPCNVAEFMPAPAGKVLWEITEQEKWEVAYDRWLGRWAGLGVYTLGDLDSIAPGPTLDLRSDMWLEEADELGILLLSLGTRRYSCSFASELTLVLGTTKQNEVR
ncbi:unnamed protein product [Clonostachys rosea]|uniref:Transcription factor domain-containing protein n=1 Tax=Bionectria ochroleuca TaxID=29856 RepID=A0ABY6UWA8_BIOOC|nr:unnamed protein product [Clonostachys rosea]